MNILAINKHNGKLENWSVEMPNVPYSKRCSQLMKNKLQNDKLIIQKKNEDTYFIHNSNSCFIFMWLK